jgi:hypothetical protein
VNAAKNFSVAISRCRVVVFDFKTRPLTLKLFGVNCIISVEWGSDAFVLLFSAIIIVSPIDMNIQSVGNWLSLEPI